MDLKGINEYSIDELYSYLLPIINNIYKEYKFIKMDNDKYKNIVLNLLNKILNDLPDYSTKTIEIHFKKQLILLMIV